MDIPGDTAFSVAALAFEGDLPASIFIFSSSPRNVADWNAKTQVIAVFHMIIVCA